MCLLIGFHVPLTLKQTLPSLGDQSCYIIVLLTAQGMFVFTARSVQPSGCPDLKQTSYSRKLPHICWGPCICVCVRVRLHYDLTLCAWSLLGGERLLHKQAVVSCGSNRDWDVVCISCTNCMLNLTLHNNKQANTQNGKVQLEVNPGSLCKQQRNFQLKDVV